MTASTITTTTKIRQPLRIQLVLYLMCGVRSMINRYSGEKTIEPFLVSKRKRI